MSRISQIIIEYVAPAQLPAGTAATLCIHNADGAASIELLCEHGHPELARTYARAALAACPNVQIAY